MPLRTWVGRFCVVDGHVEEEGAWLGSLIRQRPDDDPDELYVVVEPVGEHSVEYTSQLVDVVAQLYRRDPLSLTGALTRSLRAAHDHLRDWNRKSLEEHRVAAGASCLALRGSDAYLAQVGPSLAYILTAGGEFRRLQPESTSFEDALGVADEFEPTITRIALAAGDLVLLASTRLEGIASEHHIRRILERGADDALPELYMLTRDEPGMAVVLLSCFDEPDPLPEFLTRESPPDQEKLAASGTNGNGHHRNGNGSAAQEPEPVGAGISRRPPLASASVALGSFDAPRRPLNEQIREIAQSTAPLPATNVRLRGDKSMVRYKRTTGTMPLPQLQIPKLALLAAVAIIAVVALAWWQLPRSVAESREEKFATLLAEARESHAQAEATDDTGLKRQLLTDAQSNLADAEKIHDDNGELIALKGDVAAAIALLNAVFEVDSFSTIINLAQQVTGSVSVIDTVIGGNSAYLLDAEEGRVIRVALDGTSPPETIIKEGEAAGFVTVARPAQIAWAPQTESLLIFDQQRRAFGYFPDRGTLPLTIRDAESWGSMDAIAASGGNLYLLDVKGNQVWRYLPGQGGFDSERTALIDGATLTSATEVAVGQDVYVLDDKAGIRRFTGKQEVEFPLSGIDVPLMSPASLSVLPGSNRIVVADRGNKRIVVASAEGEFLRQIVSPSFTDLRAVAVDEGTGTLYVLNGDTLMRAPFPP